MRIRSLPKNERPVEKTCSMGIEKLSNSELLALVLHTGSKNKSAIGLAEDVLSLFPEGIGGMGGCSLEELLAVSGIGRVKACSMLAAVELGKRIAACPVGEKTRINSSDDIAGLVMEELRYQRKEHFKCILVNSKGEILSVEEISVGELTGTVVHPRETFQSAIRKSAAAVIFVHNHPSGDPSPSDEDVETTKRLAKCGEILGIRVLDHIIIGNGTYSSMREMDLIG